MFWTLTAFLLLVFAYALRSFAHVVAATAALAITITIFKGWRWGYWVSAVLLAFSTGHTLLELQFSSYRTRSIPLLWVSLSIGVALLSMQQFRAFHDWFEIIPNKRHRTIFWLTVGMFIVTGQFLIPILKSLIA